MATQPNITNPSKIDLTKDQKIPLKDIFDCVSNLETTLIEAEALCYALGVLEHESVDDRAAVFEHMEGRILIAKKQQDCIWRGLYTHVYR